MAICQKPIVKMCHFYKKNLGLKKWWIRVIFFTKIHDMCRDYIFQVKKKKPKTKKFRPKTKHWPPTQLQTSINNKHIFLLCTLWGGKKVTNLKQNSKCAPYFFGPSLVVVLVVTCSSPIYFPGKLWLGRRGWSISIHPSIHPDNKWLGRAWSIHPSIHPNNKWLVSDFCSMQA